MLSELNVTGLDVEQYAGKQCPTGMEKVLSCLPQAQHHMIAMTMGIVMRCYI